MGSIKFALPYASTWEQDSLNDDLIVKISVVTRTFMEFLHFDTYRLSPLCKKFDGFWRNSIKNYNHPQGASRCKLQEGGDVIRSCKDDSDMSLVGARMRIWDIAWQERSRRYIYSWIQLDSRARNRRREYLTSCICTKGIIKRDGDLVIIL